MCISATSKVLRFFSHFIGCGKLPSSAIIKVVVDERREKKKVGISEGTWNTLYGKQF